MSKSLLQQFLEEECDAGVCRMIEAAINPTAAPTKHFEFNRFDVTIRRAEGTVTLDDDLDVSETGTQHVAFTDFVAAFELHAARFRS